MIRKQSKQVSARRGMFIPCALACAALLLILCTISASATSAGRRTVEVARSARWIRLAAASAFDEAVARVEVLSLEAKLPKLSSPTETRDLSTQLQFLTGSSIPTTLTNQAFRDESVTVGPVTFSTGPWDVQSSGGSEPWIRETGLVELSVLVKVQRAGQRVTKLVTVQRYAAAVPVPPPGNDGFRITISPMDVFHLEENK